MASEIQRTTEEASGSSWKDVLEDILPPQGEWSEEEYLVLTGHRARRRIHRWQSRGASLADR